MKQYQATLDPKLYQNLTQKSWSRWLTAALLDWMIIISSYYVAALWNHPAGYFFAIIAIGSRQHGLALLGHEGTHFTIHKIKKWNDLISDVVAFWPVGLSTTGYRSIHFVHHQYLNTERDPELMHRSSKAPQWDLPITLAKVTKYIALDFLGYSISDYLMIIRGAKPDSNKTYLGMIFLHIMFVVISFAMGAIWIPVVWYLSLLTAFMAFFRLRTWLEHQGSDDTHRLHLHWLIAALFSPHGAWYHHEHHAYPAVPFHKMPLLRKILNETPVLSLTALLSGYKTIAHIKSGTALKDALK